MEKCMWSGDQRDENDILSFEKDRDHGFSWPQRNYKCSFCYREFKSAQALGGHMNVHRRDRARMRLSSPSSNPNTSFSSPPCEAKFLPYHPLLSCVSNLPISASSNEELGLGSNPKEYEFSFDNVPIVGEKNNVAMVGVGRTKNGDRSNEYNMLELSMGLVEDAKDNQDLDLELRLGY